MYKILIAEDDLMIADMTEHALVAHGYDVCGIARTVGEAIALGRLHKPDVAIIDLRLADGTLGTAIAAELRNLGRPGVLYASANIAQVVLTTADGDASLAKPFRTSDLLQALAIVVSITETAVASLPFPLGFQLLMPTGMQRTVSI